MFSDEALVGMQLYVNMVVTCALAAGAMISMISGRSSALGSGSAAGAGAASGAGSGAGAAWAATSAHNATMYTDVLILLYHCSRLAHTSCLISPLQTICWDLRDTHTVSS